jgi:hypothetical protein
MRDASIVKWRYGGEAHIKKAIRPFAACKVRRFSRCETLPWPDAALEQAMGPHDQSRKKKKGLSSSARGGQAGPTQEDPRRSCARSLTILKLDEDNARAGVSITRDQYQLRLPPLNPNASQASFRGGLIQRWDSQGRSTRRKNRGEVSSCTFEAKKGVIRFWRQRRTKGEESAHPPLLWREMEQWLKPPVLSTAQRIGPCVFFSSEEDRSAAT